MDSHGTYHTHEPTTARGTGAADVVGAAVLDIGTISAHNVRNRRSYSDSHKTANNKRELHILQRVNELIKYSLPKRVLQEQTFSLFYNTEH